MRNETGVYAGVPEETNEKTASCPPAFLEYSWYVLLAYAMLGQAWGVVIPSLGGALLGLLAVVCFFTVGAQISQVYAPVALAIATGVSMMAVQYFLHSEQSLYESIPFIGWLFTVVIVQALSLRPRFLHRFAVAAFVIGLGVLPYMQGHDDSGLMRAAASGTGIANPNSLGMWFGFSVVYFAFYGLQSRTLLQRAVYWAGALGSLYVVAITVSRGPILAIFLACAVGLHSVLKRNFYPAVSLVLLIWLAYESEIFNQLLDQYFVRGTTETGRGKMLPLVLQRIFDSPWTGVGLDAIRTPTPWHRRGMTPHNGLLYLWLGAGIIPLICFLGYLARAVRGSLQMMRRIRTEEAAIVPALVTFALIEIIILDTVFMSAWVVVAFALATAKRASLPET